MHQRHSMWAQAFVVSGSWLANWNRGITLRLKRRSGIDPSLPDGMRRAALIFRLRLCTVFSRTPSASTTNTSFSTTSMVTSTLSASLGRALRTSAARYPVRSLPLQPHITTLTAYTSAPPIAVVRDCSQHPPPPAADDDAPKWPHGSHRVPSSCTDGDGGCVD